MFSAAKRLGRQLFGLTPYLPEHELKEVSTSDTFREAREAAAMMARLQQMQLHQERDAIGKENHNTVWKATDGMGEPVGRISMDAIFQMCKEQGREVGEAINDSDFIKSILEKNPAYRVKVTRGTRGQEY
jgi:hypothetical protein